MKKEEKRITRALQRVSPRTKSRSQSTLLRNTSGWLLPMRSIIKIFIKYLPIARPKLVPKLKKSRIC